MGPEDKVSPTVEDIRKEDIPYFPEKFRGKSCFLCNLGERSCLGQGEFLQIETTFNSIEAALNQCNDDESALNEDIFTNELAEITSRRSKIMKSKVMQNVSELDRIGYSDPQDLNTLVGNDDCESANGLYIYIHQMCAMWSRGIVRNNDSTFRNIEIIVAKSLKQRCSFCGAFGASLSCRMSCKKAFHFPCSSADCLLIISNLTVFCMDHISQAHLLCVDANILCRQCSIMGDITKLVMCSTCGDHYHSTCIGLANQPDTKSGWNCQQCSKCQICRQSDINDARLVKCEQCQKVYHATCLRPIISSIPKYGWKCNRCRICSDCGSRTPGAGTSSRWHCHYTICDSCYQQRNKGFSCPICHRAYRAAAHKEMVKCSSCNRFVHSMCDGEADLSTYHKRKESNPDYDYICPQCKMIATNEKLLHPSSLMRSFSDIDTSSVASSSFADSIKDMDIDGLERGFDEIAFLDDTQKNRKRLALKDIARRGGKLPLTKANMLTQFGRKRSRGKNRHMYGIYSNPGTLAVVDRTNSRSNDEDVPVDKKILLCSAKDKFILSQDICVMCGAVGIDQEGCLIACSQCGQCYHPYCVNIKISKVVLEKGWRCLDCTVCEGCGQKNDESRLLLCDECDISYHIYCMDPPLETVPHGNWKCKWCAICQKCGQNCSGRHPQWRNGFLECGPCASQSQCCVCLQEYVDNELIIQCGKCDRWLHGLCDSIKSEEEAEFCDSIDYHCKLCRPKDKSLSYMIASKTLHKSENSNKNNSPNLFSPVNSKASASLERSTTTGSTENSESTESHHWVDGVCVSDRGLNVIKNLTVEMKKKRKVRSVNDGLLQKDLGILATIESVVAGSSENIDGDSLNQLQKKDENYKDGMLWHSHENSPPPGFSVTTNDKGESILRKKRQRNLQKLGIGGFNVRNRAFKKDVDEKAIENASTIDADKKKKVIRKKLKSKLTETYPIYLQEAFFGKELLAKDAIGLDSGESDFSNDACASLDLFGKNIEQTSKAVGKPNEPKLQYQDKLLQIRQGSDQKSIGPRQKNQPILEANLLPVELRKDCDKRDNKVNDRENRSFPSLPNTHLYSDESVEKAIQGSISSTDTTPKEQTTRVNDVIIKSEPKHILSNALHANTVNNNISSTQSTPTLQQVPASMPEKMQSHSLSYDQVRPMQKALPSQIQSCSSILRQPQMPQGANPIILPIQSEIQQPHFTPNTFINPQTSQTSKSFYDKNPVSLQLVQHENSFTTQTFLSNDANRNVFVPARATEEPMESIVAGTQKTAEKMRRDEELGEMATISAVLYSNTQHPELKEAYPNWNDRCKQILKRWRSLTNEKKAPFLQLAKDNRSALRMRRTQQFHSKNLMDQEKSCAQQKTLKEQEQERIWKLHQAKAKEMPMTIKTEGNNFGIIEGESSKNASVAYTISNIPNLGQDYLQTSIKADTSNSSGHASEMSEVTLSSSQPSHQFDPVKAASSVEVDIKSQRLKLFRPTVTGDKDNKQLRNLLQKQTSTPPTVLPTSKPIMQMESSNVTFQQSKQYSFSNVESKICFQQRKVENVLAVQESTPTTDNDVTSIRREQQPMIDQQVEIKSRNFIKANEGPEQIVSNEFEKLDPDTENAGFGDILGGIGDGDDEDLLKSLTAEMGDDFNILEYADPELDELANNQNFLNRIDFDEGANN